MRQFLTFFEILKPELPKRVFLFNSSSLKSTNFFGNSITRNAHYRYFANDNYVSQDNLVYDSSSGTMNLANAAAGVTFSSSGLDKSRGSINFSGNTIERNCRVSKSTASGAGGVAFINVDIVNLNDATDIETDNSHAKPAIRITARSIFSYIFN